MDSIYKLAPIIIILLGSLNMGFQKEKIMKEYTLTYYYDALCGWCYGFSPVMELLHQEYKNKIAIEVVSGGLFLGDRLGPIDQVAPYIKAGAYKAVEATTGVKFGQAFVEGSLQEGKMVLNSLYPAIALCIVKEYAPEKSLEFAHLLQNAVYKDGKEVEDLSMYAAYVAQLGINIADFEAKMKAPEYKEKALEDFEQYHQTQLNGFPAVVLKGQGKSIVLSRGYVSYEELSKQLERHLN